MNREHFWPQWLIEMTGTHRTSVRFDHSKMINPKSFRVPICVDCNSTFGRELEGPTAQIFRDLVAGRGVSDREAEILVRWLWKFEGLAWRFEHPTGRYTERYTLRERVLRPIDEIRPQLVLAISLVQRIEDGFDDEPMGLDSPVTEQAIHVAGVFSRAALIVSLDKFESEIPPQYSRYRFSDLHAPDRDAKLFFPRIGFATCRDAVIASRRVAPWLDYLHRQLGEDIIAGRVAAQYPEN